MAEYKPEDYLIYFAILLIIFYISYKYIFKKIKFDRKLIISIIPAMLLAIGIRLLVDVGYFEKSKLWNVTPGVYILGFIYGLLIISLGKLFEKIFGMEYHKVSLIIGFIPVIYIYSIFFEHSKSIINLFISVSLSFITSFIVYKIFSNFFFNKPENLAIIFAHSLDAYGSFIGIDFYNFSEEHILAEFLIKISGTAAILIPIKIIVVSLIIHFIDKSFIRGEISELFYKMIKLIIFVIGFGPGVRNSLLITLV